MNFTPANPAIMSVKSSRPSRIFANSYFRMIAVASAISGDRSLQSDHRRSVLVNGSIRLRDKSQAFIASGIASFSSVT